MKKVSQESYYQRLKELAEVNKVSVKESKNRTLGTLIDYKRAADGVAYGIIKENHNYYIKKGGIKSDPDVTDFAYIGGLANITNFQYKSLAEADKNRNMFLHAINEAASLNLGKKKKINEDSAGEEIDKAKKKLGDLDAATAAAEETPDAEMTAGLEAEPKGDSEVPAPEGDSEVPAPEGDGEVPAPEGDSEVPAPEGDGEELDADALAAEKSDPIKDIEKAIGKLTNSIRKTELEPAQTKSFVNSFLTAFKDKFPKIEIEDRKDMANKILKVVPPEDVAALSAGMPKDEIGENDDIKKQEETCDECGSFAMYAESMGFDSAQSLMECGEEGVTNLISGYANAHADGMNDGDHENVALIVKILNPEILSTLKNDYGHEEYADKLAPYVQEMNEETEEVSMQKLEELWSGLGGAFKKVGGDIKGAAQQAGQAIAQKAQQTGRAVNQYAKNVQQAYHGAEVSGEVKKLERIANDLGRQVGALNTRLQKAGKQPLNIGSVVSTLANQIRSGSGVGLSGTKVGTGLTEDTDPAMTEVMPEENIGFAGAETLGAGVVKPDGAPTSITVESKDGTKVEVGLHEILTKAMKILTEAKLKSEGNTFTSSYDKKVEGASKPSAGLSKEKKSEIVKAAKAGKNIGKTGKGFKEVENAAKKGGADDPKAVAATAMWKNIKRESVENENDSLMSESELKLRKYIRRRLEEKAGLRKPSLNENTKSKAIKKLDKLIDENFENENDSLMSESELKLRKYIRRRLEEKAGLRKPSLNENTKSEAIKKLDKLIDENFEIACKK